MIGLPRHPRRAQRLDRGRRVVRVGRAALVPRPSARSALLAAGDSARLPSEPCRPAARSASTPQMVELTSVPMRPSARTVNRESIASAFAPSARSASAAERDVRGIVGGLGGQVGGGARGGLPCGGEAEHGPRRQFGSRPAARLGEAAVRLLARAQIRGRGDGDRQRDERSLQAHTTSVCRRRP